MADKTVYLAAKKLLEHVDKSPIAHDAYIVNKAINFAVEKHGGQVRKYDGTPYVHHPLRVAYKLLRTNLLPKFMLSAVTTALLHDTVEDTDACHSEILREFGQRVAAGVWFLTDVFDPLDGINRADRKEVERERMHHAPNWVKLVKYYDVMDNANSIRKFDPEFYTVFEEEVLAHFEEDGMHELAWESNVVVPPMLTS